MQEGDHQDSAGNILSPEAKEFVPRQLPNSLDAGENGLVPGQDGFQFSFYEGYQYAGDSSKLAGQHPVGSLPSYMTTCYPFVPAGETRFSGLRPRGRGKFNNPQMYVQAQFSPTQPGLQRNRFPHPTKGFMQAWNRAPLNDMYQPFSNVPNGMPFDGGTYQNGFIRPSLPQMPVHDSKPVMSPRPAFPNSYVTNSGDAALVNGYEETPHQWNTPTEDQSSVAIGKRSNQTKKVNEVDGICIKTKASVKTQTDFPDSIANATLDDLPNSLFKKSRKLSSTKSKHKTHRKERDIQTTIYSDSDENDAEKVHSNIVHRKNQVSNGTNPAAIRVASGNNISMATPSNQFVLSYKEIVTGNRNASKGVTDTSVPYTSATNTVMLSYASIAQGLSSHNNNNKSGPVTMATKSDKETCDSSGKNAKSSSVTSGLNNVNVAQIIEDLEKAGTLNEMKSQGPGAGTNQNLESSSNQKGESPVYTWGQATGSQHTGGLDNNWELTNHSGKLKQSATDSGSMNSSANQVSRSLGQESSVSVQKSGLWSQVVKDQGQSSSGLGTNHVGHTGDNHDGSELQDSLVNDNLDETGMKKKRRRRRRRKKKSGEPGAASDDANSGANEEVMLHFEDEDEFPDLGGSLVGGDKESSPQGVPFTYSDILKTSTSSPRPASLVQDSMTVGEEEQCAETSGAAGKESRSSRKRRKRREVANKAADAEMAEINLEQHMLELKMKQKNPLSTKKSASPARKPVSPVRTSPVQSIWKHPPSSSSSQTPSSGKKVSLLLPGTVAPDNAPAARQPNPSAKQYSGILKTTQSSTSQSPSSGGGTVGSAVGGGKKSKQPIMYDLGALIDALEEKKNQPKKEIVKPIRNKREEVRSSNILDSSAPIKRGKERETPKIKKPSPLKKVILKEREEKKRLRLLDEDEAALGGPVGIGVVSGESDLSQDASSSKGSMEVGLGTPASAELSPISQPSPSCISPMSPGASPVSSGVNSPMTGSTQQIVKLKIHSRRFREYCNQVLDKEIDNCVILLLTDLVRFQDKQYHKDPIKAKAKRRFVLGLREVTKHLKLRKIKCVIISPNLEKIQSKGGLDDALNNILELCNEHNVPFVFALGRRALGRACAKLVPVSVVGIFNYEGSEENFKSLVSLTEKARDSYKEMISQIEKELAEQPPRAHVPGVPHIFAHMGHSRTPSGCSVISFTSSILSEPISENYPCSEPETDHRGYEIEKNNGEEASNSEKTERNAQDRNIDMFEKDPYEADDESGGTKKLTSNKTSNISQHISSDSNKSTNSLTVLGQSNSDSRLHSDTQSRTTTVVHGNENDVRLTRTNTIKQTNDKLTEHNTDASDGSVEDDMSDHVSDFEDIDENTEHNEEEEYTDEASDNDQSREDCDTIQELPFIDSVHHFDLHEILSTHSSKTLENGEDVLSTHSSKTTHSSRTPGESGTLAGDKNCKIKIDIKHGETTSSLSLKGKNCLDKENRTLSWVQEAQTLHFNDEIEKTGETEENAIEVSNVSLEYLDVVA